MKLLKKKVLSSAMALAMVASFALPMMSAYADTVNGKTVITGQVEDEETGDKTDITYTTTFDSSKIKATVPETTVVNIYKVAGTKFENAPFGHDGGKISDEDIKKIGSEVTYLGGVVFNYIGVENAKLTGTKAVKAAAKNAVALTFKDHALDKSDVTDKDGFIAKLNATVDAMSADSLKNVEGSSLDEKKAAVKASIAASIVEADLDATAETTGLTTANLKSGSYFFLEKSRPTEVSSGVAVPFSITLPLTNSVKMGDFEAGTGYLTEVSLYPKNVKGDLPKPEKDVEEVGNDKANYNIGDVVPWIISTNVPGNIADYEKFEIYDTVDTRLDFVAGSIKVYYTDKTTMDEITKTAEVPAGSYTITGNEPTGLPADRTLKVTVTDFGAFDTALEGMVAKDTKAKDYKLYVVFDTKINATAVMGKEIPNQANLDYDNTNNGVDDKTTEPTDKNIVETGGKLFHKNKNGDKTNPLAGAVFALNDGEGENSQMIWTDELIAANDAAIKAGQFADASYEKVTSVTKGDKIFMISDDKGEFGMKGLQYTYYFNDEKTGAIEAITEEITKATGVTADQMDSETFIINQKPDSDTNDESTLLKNVYLHKHAYNVKEVKAPANFALREDKIDFVVNSLSYNTKPTEIEVDAADAEKLEIENRDLTIPQTGGIGTVLFAIAGTAVMGGAAFMIVKRRRSEEN